MEDVLLRLCAANTGSYELSLDVAFAANWDDIRTRRWDLPAFTTNVHDALRLLPDHIRVTMTRLSDGWYVLVDQQFKGDQKPLALGLCIAAVKYLQWKAAQ